MLLTIEPVVDICTEASADEHEEMDMVVAVDRAMLEMEKNENSRHRHEQQELEEIHGEVSRIIRNHCMLPNTCCLISSSWANRPIWRGLMSTR